MTPAKESVSPYLSERWLDAMRRLADETVSLDAVVVGSGYGGAVAALRLAEMGWQVTLLERGSELRPGDFPEDLGQALPTLRAPAPEGRGVLGNALGLHEFHAGPGLVALTGNGLGGGSLINAGVLMRPEAEVFTQAAWPAEIRTDVASLSPHFELAYRQLQGRPAQGLDGLPKAQALARLGQAWDTPCAAAPVNLTINLDACTRCGDCAAGCNVPGAKLTLRDTYLAQALATGRVQVFTGATVYRLSRVDAADPQLPAWQLQVLPTDRATHYRSLAEAALPRSQGGVAQTVQARLLVLAAGALGSTTLLQRARQWSGQGLWWSGALGTRLSANGDSLSFSADEPQPVDALGLGADLWQAQAHQVGPTITQVLDLRDPQRPLAERLVVEDGAVPAALGRVFAELLATGVLVQQMAHAPKHWPRWQAADPLGTGQWLRGLGHHPDAPSLNAASRPRHTQVLLTMGHDESAGRIVWQDDRDASVPFWVDPAQLTTYQLQTLRLRQASTAVGGTWVPSPSWQQLPQPVLDLLGDSAPAPLITTVHPLGGCPMGDDPRSSVVNHLGQVWRQEEAAYPETPEQRHYRTLFVLDGAIVPTSLGCNPMWTITMLAERAMASGVAQATLASLGTAGAPGLRAQPTPAAPLRQPLRRANALALAVSMEERLSVADLPVHPALGQAHAARPRVHADVLFRTQARPETSGGPPDWLSLWDEPDHRVDVAGTLRLEIATPAGAANAGPPSPAVVTYVAVPGQGQATLLQSAQRPALRVVPASWPWHRRWLRRLRGALEDVVLRAWDLPLQPLRAAATALIQQGWMPPPKQSGSWAAARSAGWPPLATWRAWWRLLRQACEIRRMDFDVVLALQAPAGLGDLAPPLGDWPARLRLRGHKQVDYAATWGQLARWLGRSLWRLRLAPTQRPPLPLLRPTYLEQISHLWVQLEDADSGASLAAPRHWQMDFKKLLGSLPMRVGAGGDLPSAMAALAAYPGVFGRLALKTRWFDQRGPRYSGRPLQDDLSPELLRVRVPGVSGGPDTWVSPDTQALWVPLGVSTSDPPDVYPRQRLSLRLHRYRRLGGGLPDHHDDLCQGQPVRKVRSVLLVHAFGQSGYSFTVQSAPCSLAGAFLQAGYEVWVLDHRISTRLAAHQVPSNMDQIARYDVPAAVRRIVHTLQQELSESADPAGAQAPVPPVPPVQIYAFAQCIGAAATAMAQLSGALHHGGPRRSGPPPAADQTPRLPMLAGLVLSQTHMFSIGAPLTQARTWLPAFLRDVLRLPVVPFAVRDAQPSLTEQLGDRLFSALPVPEDEQCPSRQTGDHDEDDCATCRRIRFIEAPLFKHRNLSYATHRELPLLFGAANLRLFAHAARCADAERLVTEDGFHAYVSDAQLWGHFALPVVFLHGQENELFDVESAQRTAEAYARVHPALADLVAGALGKTGPAGQASERAAFIVPGYGHLDVLIGQQAQADVFQPLIQAFEHLHRQTVPPLQPPVSHAVARVPLNGPNLGSLRRDAHTGQVRLELSFRIDDRFPDGKHGPDAAPGQRTWAFVRVQVPGQGLQTSWQALQIEACPAPLPYLGNQRRLWRRGLNSLRVARGEVSFDWPRPHGQADGAAAPGPAVTLECISVHEVLMGAASRHNTLNRDAALPLDPALAGGQRGGLPDPDWLEDMLQACARRLQDLKVDDRPQRRTSSYFRLKPTQFEQRLAHISTASLRALLPEAGACGSDRVTLVAGSCRYPGFRFDLGRVDQWLLDWQAAQAPVASSDLSASEPALGLLLGDQIYADVSAGFVDPLSPIERYFDRYRQAFARSRRAGAPANFGDWLATLPVLMTPDDHEFSDGFPDGRPLVKARPAWSARAQTVTAAVARQALQAYQQAHVRGWQRGNGVWQLEAGPVRIMVLDTRSQRRSAWPQPVAHGVLTPAQLHAVQAWLQQPAAKQQLNLLATGSVLLPGLRQPTSAMQGGMHDSLQANPHDRDALLALLVSAFKASAGQVKVLLVSGDYHLSAAAELHCDGQTLGACLLVPPLFAPMPFANSEPQDLWWDEFLPHGLSLNPLPLQPGAAAQAERGSGLGSLTVRRLPLACVEPGGRQFELHWRARVRALEAGGPNDCARDLALRWQV